MLNLSFFFNDPLLQLKMFSGFLSLLIIHLKTPLHRYLLKMQIHLLLLQSQSYPQNELVFSLLSPFILAYLPLIIAHLS